MKKLFLGCMVCFFFFGAMAELKMMAQENVVSISPLALVNNRKIALGYERVLSDKLSIRIRVAPSIPRLGGALNITGGGNDGGTLQADYRTNGIELTPELRFYPKGEAPTGFYVGPFVRWGQRTSKLDAGSVVNTDGETLSGEFRFIQRIVAPGIILGAQNLFGERFIVGGYFGIGFGPQRYIFEFSDIEDALPEDYASEVANFETEFNEAVRDTPFENAISISTESTNNSGTVKAGFGFPMIRIGLQVGLGF